MGWGAYYRLAPDHRTPQALPRPSGPPSALTETGIKGFGFQNVINKNLQSPGEHLQAGKETRFQEQRNLPTSCWPGTFPSTSSAQPTRGPGAPRRAPDHALQRAQEKSAPAYLLSGVFAGLI